MKDIFKKIAATSLLTGVFFVAGIADAAVFRFGDDLPERLQSGQTLLVPVYLAPEYPGEEILLAGLSFSFSRESLWMRSFTLAPEWLAVSDVRSTHLSNERGTFTAAAGYAGKVNEPVFMGVLEFVATKEGGATLALDDASYIFGKNNRDILTKGWLPQHAVTVSRGIGTLPEQLFDIGVTAGRTQYEYKETPSVRLSFQSFGSVPTPVDIAGRVVSDKGVVVFEWKDAIVVETEFAYVKKVPPISPALALDPGYYTVLVTTHYNGDITDTWRDTFTIRPNTEPMYVYGGALLAVIVGVITIFLSRRRRA